MKKTLTILLSVLLFFVFSACSMRNLPDERPTKTDKTGKTDGSGKTQNTYKDIQEGIPSEYRLKQNVPIGWDDPLPSSENSKGAFFFDLIGQERGNNNQRETPEVKDLFTIAEIEAFFGLKVKETKEENMAIARSKRIEYIFESEDASPYLDIEISSVQSVASAKQIFSYFEGEPLEEEVGIISHVYRLFGATYVDILSPTNEIIGVSADDIENERETVIAFAKVAYQRFIEKYNTPTP